MNGGKCTQTANTFKCSCPAGWTGQICDVQTITCEVAAMSKGKLKTLKKG